MNVERVVDHSAIRTNQVFTITQLALAFVLGAPAINAVTGAIMLLSAISHRWGCSRGLPAPAKTGRIVRPHAIPTTPSRIASRSFGGSWSRLERCSCWRMLDRGLRCHRRSCWRA